MNVLNDLREMERRDPAGMHELLRTFPKQLEEARRIGETLSVDPHLAREIRQVVFTGLGGSAIGADVIRTYVQGEIGCPLFVNRSYSLPRFVDRGTLLVVSSYSGNTEETLSCYEEGKKRQAPIVAISSGGQLEAMARSSRDPHIKIPSGYPPRAALGFSVIPLLYLLDRLGLIKFRLQELDETVAVLSRYAEKFRPEAVDKNEAKQFAAELFQRYPLIYGAQEPLEAVILRWRGQIEENAKALATHHVLPEMNHNEIVGWENPRNLFDHFVAVFLRDRGEHPRVQVRMAITQDWIRRQGGRVMEVWSEGTSLLARLFSLIYRGDFVSFYLAMLYEVDPTPVRAVDYLKGELARVRS